MATIVETIDALANISTPYSLSVGDVFTGSLTSGDEDWIAITLTAGQSISVQMLEDVGSTGLFPTLNLYNSVGTLIDGEDSYTNASSALLFTATVAGVYYISAKDFNGTTTGDYTVSVSDAVYTHDQIADQLTTGYWQATNRETHAFDVSGGAAITVDITALTAAGQALATAALGAWAEVTGITFTFGALGLGADITFDDVNGSGGARTAYANYSATGNTTVHSNVNVSESWINYYGTTLGSYSFQTYIHEIGHSLGLGHGSNYNGSANYLETGGDNLYLNDSWQATVMSYFDQAENTTIPANKAYIIGPMMADIIAVQTLYGLATPVHNETDTVYDLVGANTAVTTSGLVVGGNTLAYTLFDTGGIDTVDASAATAVQVFDLNDETYSDLNGLTGNFAIARGTMIENFWGGSNTDVVTGNELANSILGNAGNDTLYGAGGDDSLDGGLDDDLIYGGNDADWLQGNSGLDTIYGGIGNDELRGGRDNDRLFGEDGNDTMYGAKGQDSLDGGLNDDVLYGGNDADWLQGNSGLDTIYGGIGNDEIRGGKDNDRLFGEDGNDTMYGAKGQDSLDGGLNDDVLYGGNDADWLQGNSGADVIYGGTGSDALRGGKDNDSLYGGSDDDNIKGARGDDTLSGGTGADTFVFTQQFGNDLVLDYAVGTDKLSLDDAIWGGGLTAAQVISTYAGFDGAGNVVLDFGLDDVTLQGVTSTASLDLDLLIV